MMEGRDLERIFAANVKAYRQRKGMTQGVLAAKAETDIRYIQNIEAGDRVPGVIIAYRIATALDITVDKLFDTPPDF